MVLNGGAPLHSREKRTPGTLLIQPDDGPVPSSHPQHLRKKDPVLLFTAL